MIKTIFGLVVFLLVMILIAWRFLSKRQSIPCPTWLSWMVEVDNPFSTISHAATIIEHSDIEQGMTVLDAGCGPGRVTIPLALKVGQNGQVIAMDIQAGMLERTKMKAKKANLTNIQFLNAGLGEKKLEYNKFDRVFLVAVLGEIPSYEAALKEIFDALKPHGILSISEIIFDPHYQRQSTVLRLTNAVGFKEKKRFGNCIAYTLILQKP